jgi:hypothetical protein
VDTFEPPTHPEAAPQRPWIGVRFLCAGAYVRVTREPDGTRYVARCPRCAQPVHFRVGPDGTSARFFDVSCAHADGPAGSDTSP